MLSDRTPYTYLLGWTKQNMWYYGVRFAKNCHPSDIWKKYKTSSKYVKNFTSKYGDPDIIEIRKVFNTIHEAREWETKVLTRLKINKREDFLNKTNNISIYYPKITESHKELLRALRLGKKNTILSEINKQKIGSKNPFFGKKHSAETLKKMSGVNNPMFGKCGNLHPRYGKQGAAKGKKWYHDRITRESKYYTPGEEPKNFIPGRCIEKSIGKKWYHNPITNESKYCTPGEEPNNFILGKRKKG